MDAFELWCWRSLLRVSWIARRSNQSILKEISPGYSLDGLMLKLKLQYFGHLMRRADSFKKILMPRDIEGRKRRGWHGWMASLTQWIWVWVNSGSWCWTGRPGMLQFMGLKKSDMTEWLNWSELIYMQDVSYNCSCNCEWVSEVAHSCPTLCEPMNCSLPVFSIHGIFQARVLKWVAISFSRRSSQPRDWTWVSHIVGRHSAVWATREVHASVGTGKFKGMEIWGKSCCYSLSPMQSGSRI